MYDWDYMKKIDKNTESEMLIMFVDRHYNYNLLELVCHETG